VEQEPSPNGGLWPQEKVETAVRAACLEALPRHKQPSAYYLVPELPSGPTGKVVRGRLKELVTAQQ